MLLQEARGFFSLFGTRVQGVRVCRLQSIDEDIKPAIDAINKNRSPGTPALTPTIGWEQLGPLAQKIEKSARVTTQSRHTTKFASCGASCVRNVNTYYKKDFELLKYPLQLV